MKNLFKIVISFFSKQEIIINDDREDVIKRLVKACPGGADV